MEPTYKSTSEFTELHSSDCGFDDGRDENVGPRFIDGCPTSAGSSPSLRWRRGTNQSSGGGDAPVSIPHPITELPFHALSVSLSLSLFSFHPFLASHCNVRCRRGRRRYKRIVVRSSERGGEGTSVAIQSTVRHAPIWDSLSPSFDHLWNGRDCFWSSDGTIKAHRVGENSPEVCPQTSDKE